MRWEAGEQADVGVESDRLDFAFDTTRVQGAAAASPAPVAPVAAGPPPPGIGGSIAWSAPLYSGTLLRATGAQVPFSLVLDASVEGSGILAAGSTRVRRPLVSSRRVLTGRRRSSLDPRRARHVA